MIDNLNQKIERLRFELNQLSGREDEVSLKKRLKKSRELDKLIILSMKNRESSN